MLAASWSACGAEAPPDLLLVTKVRLLLFHHQDDEVDGRLRNENVHCSSRMEL